MGQVTKIYTEFYCWMLMDNRIQIQILLVIHKIDERWLIYSELRFLEKCSLPHHELNTEFLLFFFCLDNIKAKIK